MATSNTPPRKGSAFNTMRAKGWALCLVGSALLSSPMLLAQSHMSAAYANALRPAGWFAFAAGAVLLGLHHIAQTRRAKANTSPPPQPVPPSPDHGQQPTLRDVRDEIKRKTGSKT